MPAKVFQANRRFFLAGSAALAAASLTEPAQAAIVTNGSAGITPERHELMRVKVEIDVKGNVKVPDNVKAATQTRQSFPVVSKATLDYEERLLSPEAADQRSEVVAAERFYHTAVSESVLNKTTLQQNLRESMRHAIVCRESLPETIYSQESYFTHGELSLLKSPVSSVSIDLFLPGESIIQDDRYEIKNHALCSVLNLTSIESGKVESTVVEVSDQAVRFRIEGEIEGTVDGVVTRQRLIGKMTFDRDINTCTWLALAVHETREISRAEPGFDITATIRMVRRPMQDPVALPPEIASIEFGKEVPAERMYVELQSRQLQVGTMMDRRWRMIADAPGSAVLRMIDNDISIAQCNLRPLVRLPEGKEWTLQAFESDARQALGDNLRQLIEGDQRVSAQGLRVLRVVADGETEGVPIRWIMMHFSDDTGRRVQATFTMAGDKVPTFAGNDAQFADSLRFIEPEDLHDGNPGDQEGLAGDVASDSQIASEPDLEGEHTMSSSELR